MKKLKKIPKFKSEDEERKFWDTHDTTDYFDWRKAERVTFPNLRTTEQIKIDDKFMQEAIKEAEVAAKEGNWAMECARETSGKYMRQHKLSL